MRLQSKLAAGWPAGRRGFLLLAISAVAVAGCVRKGGDASSGKRAGDTPPAPSVSEFFPEKQPEGHLKMVRVLKEIAERTPEENLFLGERRLHALEAALKGVDPSAAARERGDLHRQLSEELLRVGRTSEAIEECRKAVSLFQQAGGEVGMEDAIKTLFQLALSYLRLAEESNCVAHHTTESCLMPIQGGGIHVDPAPSRSAIEVLAKILSAAPDSISARWLLNIAYMTTGGYPDQVPKKDLIPPETFASEESFPRFKDAAPPLGLNLLNLSGGAIADDFDNDGNLDLVISTFDTRGQLRYFHNDGDGAFSDRTEAAGLAGLLGGLNMVQADYDNDGRLDFYVIRGAWLGTGGRHPDSLIRNNGGGTFTDVTFDAGLGEVFCPSQTAAWADYDLDGDVDLYVGNETSSALRCPGQLFRNDGGRFTDVASHAGVENLGFTKGVVWGDYDGDRFPDLYVSNLGGENRLYKNQGDGTFADVAAKLGVALPFRSFPVWFWDFDNDGALDLFVSSYWPPLSYVAASYLGLPHNGELARLYKGDGQGGLKDVAPQMNLKRLTLPMGSNFGDLDNDGYLDFYLGTGYPGFEGLMPNVMYRNRGGKGFADVTTAGGFGHLQKGHAVSFADFDNDGDLDVFAQMGGAYLADKFMNILFENPGFGNNFLGVRLLGTRSNRSAIGARIRIEVAEPGGGRRSIFRWVNSGGSFGANPLRQHFGLAKAERAEVVEVFWPATGATQTFKDVPAGRIIEITEGDPAYRERALRRTSFRR